MDKNSRIELAVDMKSPCCAKKVEKAVQEICGIKSIKVDVSKQTVIVEGDVIAEKLKNVIEEKTGMFTVIMGLGSLSNPNLGAAVAAIEFGDSSVKGMLRMTQVNPETCVIEGSLDGLPDSNKLSVFLHESGDLTRGCDSCGPPYGLAQTDKDFIGIISHLKRENDSTAHFRCTSSKLNVDEMYGRCIVVHNGDEDQVKNCQSTRLACGLVARSSGLFENSKRFCACDGVTIWEEKRRTDEKISMS